ncbi:MAG: hypothetical protein PHY73_07060 [Candidatus Omnitrophica bacterium]|nr:hypothetical protein [Candidatus Omnitrophota bacterium]
MINIKITKKIYSKLLGWFVIFAFLANMIMPTPGFAQNLSFLPTPGTMVTLTPSFAPVLLRGVRVNPKNPFELDFIVDVGDTSLNDQEFEKESEKLIKYFLASLTIPESDLWVNLSPYEEDRIIPDAFSQTEMGRDLLAQDYILKQITASLIYPEDELGKQFWSRIYKQAFEQYGTTQIPVNTFNKVWIVPERAVVYENGPHAFVVNSHLKVMLEEDYLSLESNIDNRKIGTQANDQDKTKQVSNLSSQIVREIVLPEIEKEVNNGKNFASLRQIYNSLILATWFKNTLKSSILNQKYSNQAKISGVDVEDKQVREKIYNQYLDAFKKGVCDFVKVEYDQYSNRHVPRKYFSGGMSFLGNTQAAIEPTDDIGEVTAACSPAKLRHISSALKTGSSQILGKEQVLSTINDLYKESAAGQFPNFVQWLDKASRSLRGPLNDDLLKEVAQDLGISKIDINLMLERSKRAAQQAYEFTKHLKEKYKKSDQYSVYLFRDAAFLYEAGKKELPGESKGFYLSNKTFEKMATTPEQKVNRVANPIYFMVSEAKSRMGLKDSESIPGGRLEEFENHFYNLFTNIANGKASGAKHSTSLSKFEAGIRQAIDQTKTYFLNSGISSDQILDKGICFIDTSVRGTYVLFMKALIRKMLEDQGASEDLINQKVHGELYYSQLSQEMSYLPVTESTDGGQGRDVEFLGTYPVDYAQSFTSDSIPSMKENIDSKNQFLFFLLSFNNILGKIQNTSSLYESIKEHLTPIYDSIDQKLNRQQLINILGRGDGVNHFLSDIKAKYGDVVDIWSLDQTVQADDVNALDQENPQILDEDGFPVRADKVINVIKVEDTEDIIDALRQWREGFNQTKIDGKILSLFTFSQSQKGGELKKSVIDFFKTLQKRNQTVRFIDVQTKDSDGNTHNVLMVRSEHEFEKEIILTRQGEHLDIKIVDSVASDLTQEKLTHIGSKLSLDQLAKGVRVIITEKIFGQQGGSKGLDPKVHTVYGIKALVNLRTGQAVFFSRSKTGDIINHEDIAHEYFGGLSGDIIGYQLQAVTNNETGETMIVSAQVDSKLMNMPTLYDPDKGGKEITEKSVIAANKILFDGISMKKMFDSEIQIEVHQDFLPFISDARKFSWSKEKTLSVLKVYSPSSKIESRFFKNQNNVNSFKQLYSNYFKIYLKNLEAKHAIDEDLRAKGREVEKDEKFFQEEFQNLGFILSYVLLKSFFSKDENTQNEFKLFLRDIRDFIKIMNENKDDQKGNQDKEVNEIIKRIGRIFLKYINSNMDEIDNVPKDLGPITSDPGFASELNIDGATRGSIVHDLRGRFANFSGYFGLLQTEYSEYMNGEDILAEEAKRVLFLACNLITKSRKSYHDFFNFRVLDQDFKLGDNAFQVVGFDQFSNPKEVRKEIKPFRQVDEGLFGHYWPQQLKESQYLFSIRDIGGNLYDDGQPIVLLHVEKDIKPVIKAGDQAGAVSFSEKDETENREVYNVRKVLVNPKYQDKLRKQGYSGIQISQLLVALVGQWAQDQSSSQDVVFLYEPFGEKDNAISQKLFNVQPVSGLEAFLTSNFKSIDKFLREMLDQVVVINKRSSDAQNEIAFEQEFKNDDEGGEGDALVDHSGIVVTKQNPMLVVFSYKGTSYYYNRAETLIRPMGNTEFVRPETNDEIYPKLMAALEAEKNKTSSGIIPREIQDLASLAMQRFPPSGNNQCKIATDWIMETSRRETDLRLSHDFRDDTIFIPLKAGGQREHVVVDVDGEWIIDTQLKQFEKDLDVDKEFLTRGAYDKKEYYQKVLNSAKSSREDSGTSSGQDQVKKPNFSGTQLELPFGEFDESSPNKENLGGIDLGAETLEMEVQSQGERFEFNLENLDFENIEINGLYPVIINVAPVTNLPAFLGAVQEETDLKLSKL